MSCYAYLQSLLLSDFRNYKHRAFNFDSCSYIIRGVNGSGKTNFLEAISLLTSKRGLRGDRLKDIVRTGQHNFTVEAHIADLKCGDLDITIQSDILANKKKYLVDSKPLSNKNFLNKYLQCVWIIPQMDNFFLRENSFKRQFCDKMLSMFDPEHTTRINSLDKVLKERNHILSLNSTNDKWLRIIEEKIVSLSVAVVVSRISFLQQMNKLIKDKLDCPLILDFQGSIEDFFIDDTYTTKVEKKMVDLLFESRAKDSIVGSTAIGAHRSIFLGYLAGSKSNVQYLSTGEQKILFITVIIALVLLLKIKYSSLSLILLLDEIGSHLDDKNTLHVMQKILALGCQIFLTTNDSNRYSKLSNSFEFLQFP